MLRMITKHIITIDPQLAAHLLEQAFPLMLMMGESSYIQRKALMDLLRADSAIYQVQFF
jgi:hypothetical protein